VKEIIRNIQNHAKDIPSVYPVSQDTGKLLQILIGISKAEKVLELGLGYGASTIYIASILPKNGQVQSIEKNDENAAIAANHIEKADLSCKVDIIIGDAHTVLLNLRGPFDGVFIDIEIDSYSECLNEVLRLTKPGGFILTENIWDEQTAYEIGGSLTVDLIQSYRNEIFSYKDLISCELDDCILTLKKY